MDKINKYASRGTLLSSALVKEYAEIIGGEAVAGSWVGRFVQRHMAHVRTRC